MLYSPRLFVDGERAQKCRENFLAYTRVVTFSRSSELNHQGKKIKRVERLT